MKGTVMKTINLAAAVVEAFAESPRCAVCDNPLGEIVMLDVLSIESGGEFRLTCDTADHAHNEHVVRWFEVRGGAETAIILKHVGNKSWADPVRVFNALWPWLREWVRNRTTGYSALMACSSSSVPSLLPSSTKMTSKGRSQTSNAWLISSSSGVKFSASFKAGITTEISTFSDSR